MIVNYGGSEKQQRRHLTMGLLGVGLWLLMDFFPFFFSFFFSLLFLFGFTPRWQTCIQVGKKKGLDSHVSWMVHAVDFPRTPAPALPSLPSPPPRKEMRQLEQKEMIYIITKTIIIMPTGKKEHPYIQHPWKEQRAERIDGASERALTIRWHTHAKIIWK